MIKWISDLIKMIFPFFVKNKEAESQKPIEKEKESTEESVTETPEKEPIEVLIETIEEETKPKENPNKNKVVIFRIGHSLNTAGKETPRLDDGRIIKEYTLNKWITEKAVPMIDVHCNAHQLDKNKIEWTSASGTVSFFWARRVNGKIVEYSKEGKKLAIAIHEQMIKLTGLPDRAWSFERVKAVGWNYKILRKTECPTVTVECAFMTNRGDLGFLMSEEGQNKCAKAIAKGVNNYFWE